MHDKKKATTEKTPEQEALEKHVDAMMDPKQPDEDTPAAAPADDAPKTAPTLSKPLSIDKLDEVVESIAESETPKKSKKSKVKDETPKEPEVPEEPEAADIAENDTGLDDTETNKAVDDIVAYESDVMLAVADSTAEAHNKEFEQQAKPKKHPVFSTIVWTFIALAAILIIVLAVLLVMGDSLAGKLGL